MSELNSTTCKVLHDNLANYSLLEIIHHEIGNGLAVITGYTRFLQRLEFAYEQQCFCLKQDKKAQFHEKREFYLHAISQRETQLNDFLANIRRLSLYPAHTRFCQNLTKTDLVLVLKRITDRILPLYKNQKVHILCPSEPLYILCDPPWIELVYEHLINHNMAFHRKSTPVKIDLKRCLDPSHTFQEARIEMHITPRSPKRRPVAGENVFETWAQTLDQRDQDVCWALCSEILQEHGGRVWSEQEPGRKESTYVALPLNEGGN